MENPDQRHAEVMLRQVADQAERLFGPMSREQLNWKPGSKKWSIAECLDHLIQTHRQYLDRLDGIIDRKPVTSFFGKIPGWTSLCNRLILGAVDPDKVRPSKTFGVFKPTASDFPRSIVEDFIHNIGELIARFRELEPYGDPSSIKVVSPAGSTVVLTYDAVQKILWKHAVRHLRQAQRVTEMSDFPTSPD